MNKKKKKTVYAYYIKFLYEEHKIYLSHVLLYYQNTSIML